MLRLVEMHQVRAVLRRADLQQVDLRRAVVRVGRARVVPVLRAAVQVECRAAQAVRGAGTAIYRR